MRRLLLLPLGNSRIEVWLNPRKQLVITRLRGDRIAPITLKIYKKAKNRHRPLRSIKLRSRGSVVILNE